MNSKVRHIYPPDDPGLGIQEATALVGSNSALIARLTQHAATDEQRMNQRFLAPIQRLAEHINVLPATSSGLFSGEGGLLRACMEMGFLCFQASDGRIFTGKETVEGRHRLEPRWRYVCFAAGLLYTIGRPIGRMTVTSANGASWPRHHCGISEWSKKAQVDRMYVSWPDEDQATKDPIGPSPYTAAILHNIIGADNLAWLEEGSPDLARVLLEVVSGHQSDAKIALDVIATIWAKVQERERDRRPQSYGRMTVGTHLAPYLVGAMRNLVESQKWIVNELPLIVDSSGVYLVWPKAGEDLVASQSSAAREGWPSSPFVLAELLKAAGAFNTAKGNDMGMVEVIDSAGEVHSAYLLKSPRTVLENYESHDYAKKAPKTLAAVVESDPLAQADLPKVAKARAATPAPAADESEKKEHLPAEQTSNDDALAKQCLVQDEEGTGSIPADSNPVAAIEKETKKPAKKEPVIKEPAPQGKVAEVAEVKFSDLVPEELRKEIKSQLAAELLGKVIKGWRDRGQDSTVMRMTDNGAAISFDYLTSIVRDVPKWIDEVAAVGLIYSPPNTPGLKVQRVAIPEGTKPRESIVISTYGCKKLGL